MSLDKAKEHLKKFGMENRILEFERSSATVREAAIAANCTEEKSQKPFLFS